MVTLAKLKNSKFFKSKYKGYYFFGGIALLYLLFRKKTTAKTPLIIGNNAWQPIKETDSLEVKQEKVQLMAKARAKAMILSSALGSNTWWQFWENERLIIDTVNQNHDILPLIADEFYKLTKKGLYSTLTRELNPEELAQLNLTNITP